MLTSSLLLANEQEIGVRGIMLIGSVCLLVGIWFSVAVRSDRVRAVFRWNEDGSGPAMSRLGAGIAAADGYLLAAMFFARAFEFRAVSIFISYLVAGAIVATILVAGRDHARSRNRI